MKKDAEEAKALLLKGEHTCVLCRSGEIETTTLRGVEPLLRWADEGRDLSGRCAADKAVGKATAFLYQLLKIDFVYTPLISVPAAEVLTKAGIGFEAGLTVPNILNRTKTGFCPMETAVKDIDDPLEALDAIRKKFREMNP